VCNDLAGLDRGAVLDRNRRTVRHLVALTFAAVHVHDRQFAGTRYRDQMTLRVRHGLQVVELQRTQGLDLHVVHGGRTRRSATDVERTHGELSAGFADGLGGDDADRFAHVDEVSARQITAIAVRTYAEAAFAGDRRTHQNVLHAARIELVDQLFVEQRVAREDRRIFVARSEHVRGHDAAE